jgi:hypothetical protein
VSNRKGVVGNNGRKIPRMPSAREMLPKMIQRVFMQQR